jgi:putative DNA primase/helicase
VHRPRTCVFVGTTNDDHWAKDPTGGRRFWPVHVVSLDRYALQRDRDQLWAEAVAAYNSSEEWYPTGSIVQDITAEQDERFDADEWESPIARWLAPHQSHGATIGEIMLGALKIETERWTRADQMRVASVLRRLGWHKPKSGKRRANTNDRVWYPTNHQPEPELGEENF